MNPLLRSVVLVTAALLALPPGWCCVVFQPAAAQSEIVPAGCCHPSDTRPPGDRLPTTPGIDCCCMPFDAVLQRPVKPTESPSLVQAAALDSGCLDPLAGPMRDSARRFADTGPKLHVLQCVWRC